MDRKTAVVVRGEKMNGYVTERVRKLSREKIVMVFKYIGGGGIQIHKW